MWPLEWTRAEIERLHHVIGSLRKRHRVVDRQRAEWRDPGKTDAGRRAHDVVVGNLRGLRTEHGRPGVTEYATCIDKDRSLQTEFLGNAGNCALQFRGRRPV